MWLTQLAIKRPVFMSMVFGAFIVLGLECYFRLPIDMFPKIDIPYTAIVTLYPGAGPREVETLISKPLEEAVSTINNVKNVTSSSQEGISIIVIEFVLGTDLDVAASDVRARVDATRLSLPKEALSPSVLKVSIEALPVLILGVSGRQSLADLKALAEDKIKPRLEKISGVAAVNVIGGETREILVDIDRGRLDAYGLSIMEVKQALAGENLNLPSGRIEEGRKEYTVRLIGEFQNIEEIKKIKIPTSTGSSVSVEDIAQVKDTIKDRDQYTRLDRKESVGVVIQKQSNVNTVQVVDSVQKELKRLQKEMPKGTEVKVSQDLSVFIRDSVHDVKFHMLLGALFATLIVFLFLHQFRGTIIVALAIPTSIIATFIPMYFLGFSLNMSSLLGLALCVGILVDDSIVVLENIYRHLTLGEPPEVAALNGRMEIGLAAVAITLTDVVVFVPIAFMGGLVGQFFKQFGLTVAFATLFSLFVSFTLTPMLASRWFRELGRQTDNPESLPRAEKGFLSQIFARFDAFYEGLNRRYRNLLAWALRHRWAVVIIGTVVLIISLPLAWRLGGEFIPPMDQGQFTISIEMPAGTSLETTNGIAGQVEDMLAKVPEVRGVFTAVGSEVTGGFGGGARRSEYAQIMVKLSDKTERKKSVWQIMDELREKVKVIPDAKILFSTETMGAHGAALQIEISGTEIRDINRLANEVLRRIKEIPGVVDADTSWKVGKPEIQAQVDRLKAADLGLSAGMIASALRTSIEGDTSTKFREKGKEYDIRVRLNKLDRKSVADVSKISLKTLKGTTVLLSDVAEVSIAEGPSKIDRKNRQRQITVSGELRGRSLLNVMQDIRMKLSDVSIPPGCEIHYGGEFEMMRESFLNLLSALILSIILVYMVMASLFESLAYPFIIILSLPQALIGAIWALFLTGKTLSIVSIIGMIMLMGLVTKNAILLVDYTNTLRGRGKERDEALLEAGPVRLRPILMTTFTMVFGMLPVALGLGRGAEMRSPMAIAVIGGLLLSTFLTLLVIPSVYTIFDDLQKKLLRGRQK